MRTKGWQKVFGFTLVQFIKTKAFIIGTVITCLIIVLLTCGINIIPALIGGGEDNTGSGEATGLEAFNSVIIRDEAEILTDEDYALLSDLGASLADSDDSFDSIIDVLKNAEDTRAFVSIAAETSGDDIVGYRVKTYYSPASNSDTVDNLTAAVRELINRRNMINAGVSPENYAQTQRYISSSRIEAGSSEWGIFESLINYVVPMVVSLILFIMIFAYGQTVAQSIATEKTSRVMELLLTSVRPLAVVIGKVLAMGAVSLGQFMLFGIVGTAGFLISAPFGIGGKIISMANSPELIDQAVAAAGSDANVAEMAQAVSSSFGSINALTIILIFIIFILGFLFFALIAALVGASISRMEDLQQAMQPYALLGVLGFYLAYFPVIFNIDSMENGVASMNSFQMFSYYFPISSPFSLPSALLLGTLDTVQAIIAVFVLAVFVVLIAIVVGKVYEGIILHNGSRIKLGDIFKMAIRK